MKYLLYRSFGDLDKNVRMHQFVGVEYGKNIYDVSNALIKDAVDELTESPEYENCTANAFAPEPLKEFRRVKRYRYEMMGIVYPQHGDENILVDFGIIETEEA